MINSADSLSRVLAGYIPDREQNHKTSQQREGASMTHSARPVMKLRNRGKEHI